MGSLSAVDVISNVEDADRYAEQDHAELMRLIAEFQLLKALSDREVYVQQVQVSLFCFAAVA